MRSPLANRRRRASRSRTLSPPFIHSKTEPTTEHASGRWYCYGIDSVTVTLGKGVQVYINRAYASGTCEYREALTHEGRHLDVYAQTLREYAPRLRAALAQDMESLLGYPSRANPMPVPTFEGAAAFEKGVKAQLDSLARP